MACFIPVSTKQRVSFLRSIYLDTPLPDRSASEVEISAANICVSRHTATVSWNEEKWLALRSLVDQCEADYTFKRPHGRELNEDKIEFQSYLEAGMYYSLEKNDLSH